MTPTLKTNSLIIRQFNQTDLEMFANYRAQRSVAKVKSWTDYTYNDAIALFERTDYSSFGQADNWHQLAIIEKHSDKLLGDLAVHLIDEAQVEIGFTVAPKTKCRL
jgi:RimJ/RimL family protein N-acetyltransferase